MKMKGLILPQLTFGEVSRPNLCAFHRPDLNVHNSVFRIIRGFKVKGRSVRDKVRGKDKVVDEDKD